MYKIKYLITGHEFLLPDETAQELKDKFPNDYKIIEKNGKVFKDKKTIIKYKDGSIRELVVDESPSSAASSDWRGSKEDTHSSVIFSKSTPKRRRR